MDQMVTLISVQDQCKTYSSIMCLQSDLTLGIPITGVQITKPDIPRKLNHQFSLSE